MKKIHFKNKFAFFIVIVALNVVTFKCFASHELKCLSVDKNGDVKLEWIKPLNPNGDFDEYQVFYSNTLSGAYSQITSINNYNTLSYTHSGANAKTTSIYYYIVSRFGTSGNYRYLYSDTLMSLNVFVTNLGNGVAQLNWNELHTPKLNSTHNYYHLFKEFPTSVFNAKDTINNTTQNDTSYLCSASINYYVTMKDSSGCSSTSSINGDLFKHTLAPPIPILDSISVDTVNKKVILGWTKSTAGDTKGYIIYKQINGVWSPIYTVKSIDSTFYTISSSDPSTASEMYCIAAFDSCTNTSPIGNFQNSIFLNDISLDMCKSSASLSWNSYANMTNSLMGYKIFASENSGTMTMVGITNNTTTNFVHQNLKSNTKYCYFIRAFDNTGKITSMSNVKSIFNNSPAKPQYSYLMTATVGTDQKSIELKCLVDTTAFIKSLKIFRSDNPKTNFTEIKDLSPIVYSKNYYTDTDVSIKDNSYYYKLYIVDNCNNLIAESNLGRSILLTVKANEDLTNTLIWNNYENWSGKIKNYTIYRSIGDDLNFVKVADVENNVNTYNDNVANFNKGGAKFKYYIVANEGYGNKYGLIENSTSNQAECQQYTMLYVPNAFNANSTFNEGRIFKPKGSFIDKANYSFTIMRRTGDIVFETNDPDIGWDGKTSSGDAGVGVYVYLVKYKNADGTLVSLRGIVTLIR